jgi:hypothetical protein
VLIVLPERRLRNARPVTDLVADGASSVLESLADSVGSRADLVGERTWCSP